MSIRQRESSPWRKSGREVLAGQYLDRTGEANIVVVVSKIEGSMSVIVEPLLVISTMPSIWTPLLLYALKFIGSLL